MKLFGLVASVKAKIIIAIVFLLIGMLLGAWLYNKVYAYGKIAMLEKYAERLKSSHQLTIENLNALHASKLKIAKDDVKIEKVNVYVKDNRVCDINSDTEQLLDNSRTGLSIPTTGADGGTSRLAPITQRQQIKTCAKDGISYRNLLENHRSLQKFIKENWKKK